jgi:hypothetical protein
LSAPRPGCLTRGKDPVPIVQEAGWAPGPVWTCAKNLAPTGIFYDTLLPFCTLQRENKNLFKHVHVQSVSAKRCYANDLSFRSSSSSCDHDGGRGFFNLSAHSGSFHSYPCYLCCSALGVIASPCTCPSCCSGIYGDIPSTERVLRSPGNRGATDVSVLGGDMLPIVL